MQDSDSTPQTPYGVRETDAYYIAAPGEAVVKERCQVVEEDALSIDVEDVGVYTLMWTPTESMERPAGFDQEDGILAEVDDPEALALAVGFTFTEGIINGLEDIRTMAVCADSEGVVRMQLINPEAVVVRRKNVVMNSSCGICGGREFLENNVEGYEPVGASLHMTADRFGELMGHMRERQRIFDRTGGAHAAAVFTPDGALVAVAEDLGRHNALDKVIGKCLLLGKPTRGNGVVLSSRLSLEMITKAVRAGFEIIAAVSAPTSLAIEVAERFGVTLCGFVRSGRITIYSHPERILGESP